jgi:hypothetical protein
MAGGKKQTYYYLLSHVYNASLHSAGCREKFRIFCGQKKLCLNKNVSPDRNVTAFFTRQDVVCFPVSFPSIFLPLYSKTGFLSLFSSTSTRTVSHFASEHRHKMFTRTSTIYKFVKEQYPISRWCLQALLPWKLRIGGRL